MSQKASLKLTQDETEAMIIFADGKESIIFNTKNEIFKVLNTLMETKRITDEEFKDLCAATVAAKKIPSSEKDSDSFSVRFATVALAHGTLSAILRDIADQEPTGPSLTMCYCKQNHGFIVVPNANGKICIEVSSQKQATEAIKQLHADEKITGDQTRVLFNQLEASTLPAE